MKGDSKAIEYLNAVLRNELTAINQYFLHARMYGNWGFGKLNKHEYEESIDEMKHADSLIERILFLEGLPNLQDIGKLMIGEDAREMLGTTETGAECARPADRAIATAGKRLREPCSTTSEERGEHIGWLETQLELIDKVRLENLQSMMWVEMKRARHDGQLHLTQAVVGIKKFTDLFISRQL
jgi:bacterioferritin